MLRGTWLCQEGFCQASWGHTHKWLIFRAMSDVMRSALTSETHDVPEGITRKALWKSYRGPLQYDLAGLATGYASTCRKPSAVWFGAHRWRPSRARRFNRGLPSWVCGKMEALVCKCCKRISPVACGTRSFMHFTQSAHCWPSCYPLNLWVLVPQYCVLDLLQTAEAESLRRCSSCVERLAWAFCRASDTGPAVCLRKGANTGCTRVNKEAFFISLVRAKVAGPAAHAVFYCRLQQCNCGLAGKKDAVPHLWWWLLATVPRHFVGNVTARMAAFLRRLGVWQRISLGLLAGGNAGKALCGRAPVSEPIYTPQARLSSY